MFLLSPIGWGFETEVECFVESDIIFLENFRQARLEKSYRQMIWMSESLGFENAMVPLIQNPIKRNVRGPGCEPLGLPIFVVYIHHTRH